MYTYFIDYLDYYDNSGSGTLEKRKAQRLGQALTDQSTFRTKRLL